MAICNWNTVHDFFDALNKANVTYVVMRNFERMDREDFFCDGHEDIDILCEDVKCFVEVSQMLCKMIPEDDIHFVTFISEKAVPVDLRHQGDDYYDECWAKDILKNRRKADNGNWYVMSDEDYYYSLVYHAILQKKEIDPQYIENLNMMSKKLGLLATTKEEHLKDLDAYMKRKGYRYVPPTDISVPFQWKYLDKRSDVGPQSFERDTIPFIFLKNLKAGGGKAPCFCTVKKNWSLSIP